MERLGQARRFDGESVQPRSRKDASAFAVPLNDRTVLMRRLRSELADARELGHPLSLGLVSLENLTDIKIEHGRESAERILSAIECHLSLGLRACDLVARNTGSELALLLPDTDRLGARTAIGRVHSSIGSRHWGPAETDYDLGITTGVATVDRGEAHPIDILKASVASLGARPASTHCASA